MTERVCEAIRLFAKSGAESLRERAVMGLITPTEIVESEILLPHWRPKHYIIKGEPLKHEGQVYRVLQSHDSTNSPDWKPDGNTALFEVCHTTDKTRAKPWVNPNGLSGMYKLGECYLDGETVYRAVRSTTLSYAEYPDDWTIV